MLGVCFCFELTWNGPFKIYEVTQIEFFSFFLAETVLISINVICYYPLLCRHECFTGKFTTHTIETKLYPGPTLCIFYIFTSNDIHVLFHAFSWLFVQSGNTPVVSDRFVSVDKKKLAWRYVKNNISLLLPGYNLLFWPVESKINVISLHCYVTSICTKTTPRKLNIFIWCIFSHFSF